MQCSRRKGAYTRDWVTASGGLTKVRVPRDRAGQYPTRVFDRFQRYEPEVSQAIAAMFFAGVSPGRVAAVTQPWLGAAPSASSVWRIAHDLQTEGDTWRARPLLAHDRVILLDGVYFPVVHEQQADETPLLVAMGLDLTGQRLVLGFVVGDAESTLAWQSLLDDLKRRGVATADLFVTDGDEGLIGVLERSLPQSARQRGWTHQLRNVLAKIPTRTKKEVAAALQGIGAQASRDKAQEQVQAFIARYETVYPEAVVCLPPDLEACFTCYDFPKPLWRHIRTPNPIEGLFHTLRQRTHTIGAFRHETSCLLIV